jgi:hypothetical protein
MIVILTGMSWSLNLVLICISFMARSVDQGMSILPMLHLFRHFPNASNHWQNSVTFSTRSYTLNNCTTMTWMCLLCNLVAANVIALKYRACKRWLGHESSSPMDGIQVLYRLGFTEHPACLPFSYVEVQSYTPPNYASVIRKLNLIMPGGLPNN